MPEAQITNSLHNRNEFWLSESAEAVAVLLSSNMSSGLDPEIAAKRLEETGHNELRETPRPPFWKLLLAQFQNFLVIMLIVASILSALLGDYVEAIVIIAIVALNSIIGVVQESKAENALAALKKMSAPNATVIRGGTRMVIPCSELVPGDLVILEAGNYVPADLRLLEAINLRIEEAALSGESVPVQKNANVTFCSDVQLGERLNCAFMGTLITYGRGSGLVVATGMNTQIGLIADMLQTLKSEPTPLQVKLDQLARQLGYAALAICALLFLVGLFNQTRTEILTAHDGGLSIYLRTFSTELSDLFMIAVSLAIAAVPEGLPAVVTITLALGMREMVRRNALVRRLAAVETLGSASVICSDKTGTLTQNQMAVVSIWVDNCSFGVTGAGYDPHGTFSIEGNDVDIKQYTTTLATLQAAVLCSDAYIESADSSGYRMVGDPTEGALVVAAARAGIDGLALQRVFHRVYEVPFDSERKCMSTVHKVVDHDDSVSRLFGIFSGMRHNSHVITCKGAPDVILELCSRYKLRDGAIAPLTEEMRKNILSANELMAHRALRVMAVSYRLDDTDPIESRPEIIEDSLIFLGLFGIMDPPRPEVIPAIAKARLAGIRTIMITGDYSETASAVGQSIGLIEPGHAVLSGADLDKLKEPELLEVLEYTDVFARVNPEHKMRIVQGLKQMGEVVAMTGDGVNDAPALKRSDIGIAMGVTGTDVAKETADMILMDDNYVSIVSAVEEGRIIYANIRKFVNFLLSSNVAEILIIFLPTLFALPSPLTAIQLLWLNMVTDGAPALALAREKGDPFVMNQPPRPKSEPIIYGPMRRGILIQAVAQTAATLGAFFTGLVWHLQMTKSIPDGVNPLVFLFRYDWTGVQIHTAQTMAFVTLSLCELFRAFTVRSERLSILETGFFSNIYLVWAVIVSTLLLILTVVVPVLNPIFNTQPLSVAQWQLVIALAIIPAIVEEITKRLVRNGNDLRAPLQTLHNRGPIV